jgi:hypothetical protein
VTGPNSIGASTALRALAEGIGLTAEQRRQARLRYDDVAAWLEDAADLECDALFYPQGSLRIGTTNTDPVTREFDADAVFHLRVTKHDITQPDLRAVLADVLGRYVRDRQRHNHPLAPTGVEPKTRASTFHYVDLFHMDILPVVDDTDSDTDVGEPALLTDRDLARWQHTNPKGFAEWFDHTNADERQLLLAEKAARGEVQVDDLPEQRVTTALQAAVQILKLHSCRFFDGSNLAPPSIVITTLVARAYAETARPTAQLDQVLLAILQAIPDLLEIRNGTLWVPNPTNPDENFADRYAGEPAKVAALHRWLDAVTADLRDITTSRTGLDGFAKKIDAAFGAGRGAAVARKLAVETKSARETGKLTVATGGTLAVGASSRPMPDHTFFGSTDV